MKSTRQRFEDKVSKTEGCWLWTGATHRTGYGIFRGLGGKTVRAHRFSYQLYVGALPDDSLVCHSCDVPNCVNPSHLFLGTAKDNTQDMIKKGRGSFKAHNGESNGFSKLTESQARHIKQSEESGRALARKFGVSPSTISAVRTGQNWASV